MSRFNDDEYYYKRRVIYPNRILYVMPPGTVLAPQGNISPGMVSINPNARIIYTNNPNIANMNPSMGQMSMWPIPMEMNMPMNIQMSQQKQKKTIPNLSQFFEEVDLTQSILDKGEQKKCSICLEDFEVGTKIIFI